MMGLADSSVLVLGASPWLARSVARCLRRAGHAPVVHGLRRGAALDAAALRQLCDDVSVDTVMATDYAATLLLARATEQEPGRVPACAVPPAAMLLTLNDKWNFTRTLRALGLPAPDTVHADDAVQLLANRLVYPIVTTPLARRTGSGLQVHASREALARALKRRQLAGGFPMMAQSYVAGWDVGASFLAQRGRLAACSVARHKRRGEWTFYRSVRVRDYVERFVAGCGYSGVGHLDLRYDPARDSYFLLQLHPCFSPALIHAERLGLNYPDRLLKLDIPAALALPRTGRVRLWLGKFS